LRTLEELRLSPLFVAEDHIHAALVLDHLLLKNIFYTVLVVIPREELGRLALLGLLLIVQHPRLAGGTEVATIKFLLGGSGLALLLILIVFLNGLLLLVGRGLNKRLLLRLPRGLEGR
jgi:hypothetical protein